MERILLFLMLFSATAWGDQFALPPKNATTVGQWKMITVAPKDTINTLAYDNDTSGTAILQANPDIKSKDAIKIGQKILIPTCYQLPEVREGIVVNLAEHALFYFPDSKNVWVFPITIGRDVTPTPQGVFKIIKKSMNPPWFPPETIREKFAKRGVDLPEKVPPGPKNPLGKYVLYLNTPQYWIHTSLSLTELGGNRSYGCVRLYEKDIGQLYEDVPLGTPVRIHSEPVNYLAMAKTCVPPQQNS